MAGPFNTENDYYNQAATYALPSTESLDRSAARLRSRLDTQSMANQQGLADQYAGRGMSQGGAYNRALMQNNIGGQQAYAQGLGQLQDDFVKQQQAGAGLFAQMGRDVGDQRLKGMQLGNEYALGQRGLDVQSQLGNRGYDVEREQFQTNDALQRYLQGNELGFRGRELDQQGQIQREQLQAQRQSDLRRSLIDYFSAFGERGNTQGGPAFNQGFADIQALIRQALQ